ncbi:unnamed protein product [Rotaria sp. Silwood2]|nr:unnamed protein product [Rotaria sp. Silwood2]
MALSERETYYQQQIKEYQANIDRATQEAQKIRAELKQLQEENGLKEKNTKSLIDELKENYEKVQDELKELNEREYTAKMTLSQRESYYEGQIKEYENNLNQAMHETQNIQNELVKLEEEKKMHDNKSNNTINSLKQDYEKQYEILKSQLAELQHKDHTSNIILNERIGHYEIQIKEYQIKIDQHIREIETLQTELTDLQQEKAHEENQFNDMINKLQHDYDTLTFELQERDQTQNVIINEREALHQFQMKEFETKRDQSLLEIQNLQSELIKLREEKTTSENQFKQTINTLKKDHERQYKELQTEIDELNERERKAHKTVHQREAEFEQQIKDYQDKIEEAILGTDHIQNQLTELLEEKAKFDDTNKSLKQDIERLKIELQDGDHTHNMTLKERDAFYELRIKEYQIKKDQDIHEIEILRAELTNLQEEKVFHEKQLNDTIIKLKHDYETLKLELQDQDQTQNMATNESEDYYQSQIKEYQTQRDQSLLEIQDLQSELTKLREEKITIENEFNETVNTLKQDHERQCKEFQTEIDELNEREHTAHKILHQREAEFEQQIKDYPVKLEEALLETQHIQNQLAKLLEEKSKFDDANKSLKQDIERLETELQDRDRIQNMAINERDAHYQSQIKEYQNKIDESLLEMQKVQSEVTKLREEKTTIENQFNETINTLKHDDEELSNKLNERENMILNELESQYKQQIDEYQKNLELSLNEIQNIKSELANLQEEKESNDKILNNLIMSLQQDFEKQTEILKTQNIELQRYHDTKNNELNETEQQIKEYELKFDQLNKNIEELQQQNEGKIEQINQLKTELDQQHQEIKEITNIKQQYEQTQNDLNQRMENLTQINEKLKQEREDFINQNEQQFTNQDSDETTEKHVSDNLLTKQLNDLQLMYDDLLQKQANLEQKYAEDKQAQEQLMKERIAEYETKIILKQNEFMVEMENTKLDHEQELLRLKAELHQATSTNDTKNNELNETEQQIKEYESKFDQLNKNIEELQQQNENKMEQINQLETKLDQQHQEMKELVNIKQQYEQTQNKLIQQTENLMQINEKLKQELDDFKKQNEQQFKNQDSNGMIEKQVSNDQSTKQLNDLQLMYDDLLQKQANLEQKYAEDKQAQEKLMTEKIAEYETRIILTKNEFMVEMETAKLDHEYELLRLKTELLQATSTKRKK